MVPTIRKHLEKSVHLDVREIVKQKVSQNCSCSKLDGVATIFIIDASFGSTGKIIKKCLGKPGKVRKGNNV